MKKIIITGGNGRFSKILKKVFYGKNIFYLKRTEFNILKIRQLENKIKKIKPDIILHLAALSRPLSIHEQEVSKSIETNIIGTCNLVKLCSKHNIKFVYMSTHYVYPCTKGNYSEQDALLPSDNYSWSKLGGECATQMYIKNSLIIRVAMYETPFQHEYAFTNIKSNFLNHNEAAKILPKLLRFKGIINLGGKRSSIYHFAKKTKKNVKPKKYINNSDKIMIKKDSSVNIRKLKSLLNINLI